MEAVVDPVLGVPRSRWAVAGPIACGCAVAAAAAYVAAVDPNAPGAHLPACPLYQMTGLWCPGCGLTRAAHALLNGRLGAAFGYNLLFPLFFGGIVFAWLAWLRHTLGRRVLVHVARLPLWTPYALGAFVLLFGVVRNLPGFQALRP